LKGGAMTITARITVRCILLFSSALISQGKSKLTA
jgi:hypothetical protein